MISKSGGWTNLSGERSYCWRLQINRHFLHDVVFKNLDWLDRKWFNLIMALKIWFNDQNNCWSYAQNLLWDFETYRREKSWHHRLKSSNDVSLTKLKRTAKLKVSQQNERTNVDFSWKCSNFEKIFFWLAKKTYFNFSNVSEKLFFCFFRFQKGFPLVFRFWLSWILNSVPPSRCALRYRTCMDSICFVFQWMDL